MSQVLLSENPRPTLSQAVRKNGAHILWLSMLSFVFTIAASAQVECAGMEINACHKAVVKSAAVAANPYTFPDGRQQFQSYLNSAFGPLAFVRSAIGAGIDQSKPAPPEWDSGTQGYAERYGFRFGMFLVSETTKYSLGAAMREDVAYHRCLCTGFLPRSAHVFASTFTAKTRGGSTVISLPSIVAPYAGSFTAVNAWYPARYEPMDAARLGSMSFTFQIGGNMLREFLPGRGH